MCIKKIKIVLFTYMYSVVFACIHLFLMCSLYLICVRYKYSHFQDFFIFKNDKNSFYIKTIRVCFIFCVCSVCVRGGVRCVRFVEMIDITNCQHF